MAPYGANNPGFNPATGDANADELRLAVEPRRVMAPRLKVASAVPV
jgi:hypothetical protein